MAAKPEADWVQFSIPESTLAELKKALSPAQYRRACYGIVSRTQAKLLTTIRRLVKAESPLIKKKYIDRAVDVIKAKGDPPVGAVIITNRRIPLIGFRVRGFGPGAKTGGSVTIAKGLPPIVLRHGFIATTKVQSNGSGGEHEGIFIRARMSMATGERHIMHRRVGQPVKVTPQGFAERLPIKQQFGPGIFKIIELPEVMQKIEFDVNAELAKQTLNQVNRFLAPREAPATADV